MTLKDRTFLITGGSRGLGRALGETFAASGAAVVLVARGGAELERAVAKIRGRGGVAHAIVADVGDKRQIHRVVAEAVSRVGPLDGLIHAASALGPIPLRTLLDSECEDFERVLQVNLLGPFRLTKAVVGPMLMRDRGVVVCISSDAAVEAYEGWGAYGVSKAAFDQLARIWAAEVAGSAVRVLSVDPGEMDTQMHADAMPEADRHALTRPSEVATRIAAIIEDPELAPSGARVLASDWQVAP